MVVKFERELSGKQVLKKLYTVSVCAHFLYQIRSFGRIEGRLFTVEPDGFIEPIPSKNE